MDGPFLRFSIIYLCLMRYANTIQVQLGITERVVLRVNVLY